MPTVRDSSSTIACSRERPGSSFWIESTMLSSISSISIEASAPGRCFPPKRPIPSHGPTHQMRMPLPLRPQLPVSASIRIIERSIRSPW